LTEEYISELLLIFGRHLKLKHGEIHAAYEASKKRTDVHQPILISFIGLPGETYRASHPRQRMLCRSIAENLVVKGGVPVSFVDSDGFRIFLADNDPSFVTPCRQTVTYSLLLQLLKDKQVQRKGVLKSVDYVALTIDVWTDRRQHSFFGITAHIFIVAKGHPQSMLLKFQSFRGSHTAQNIAQAIEDCITENSLEDKVYYIVSDNASNMKKAMSFVFAHGPRGNIESWLICDNTSPDTDSDSNLATLDNENVLDDPTVYGDLPTDEFDSSTVGERVPCFAHSVQLAIRDGLQKTSVRRTAVAKCCKLANLTHQSAKFRVAFEDAFGRGRAVPSSNDTRWNSVFH